jgi:hypothetical protein
MKISNLQRFDRGDYVEAPAWFHRFLETLNPILDEAISALKQLTIDENFNGIYKTVEVLDLQDYEIKTGINGKAKNVVIAGMNFYSTATLCWENISKDSIRFRVIFDPLAPAPSAPVKVTLQIIGE